MAVTRRPRLGTTDVTITRLNEELRIGVGTPTGAIADILSDYLATAWDLVDGYKGDDTPASIRNEAAVRVAAWLYDQPATARMTARQGILLASGAAALLGQWRPRRALPLDADAETPT